MKKFVEQNKEALMSLAAQVRELDNIRSVKDERDLIGRKYAIEIIDGWLTEIFNITTEDLNSLSEDEDLDIISRD